MRRSVIALATLIACSNNSQLTYDEFVPAVGTALCGYLARCGLFPDEATCESANAFSVELDPTVAAEVANGKVSFDGGDAAQCVADLAAMSCDMTAQTGRLFPPSCNTTGRGTVAELGACASPGTPCGGDDECASGNYCKFGASDVGTCAVLVAAGGACSGTNNCAFGLGCPGTTQICAPLPDTGEPCPDGLCREIGDHCGSAGTCAAVGLPGAPCASADDCSLYYQCDATSHCAPGPRIGDPCTDSTPCFDAGTACDSSTGTCVMQAPGGGACADADQCDDFSTCTDGHCVAKPVCI